MFSLTYNPCLLITDKGTNLFSITRLQTNNTLSIVIKDFAQREEEELVKAKFYAKLKIILTHNTPIKFNSSKIRLV
jgi:hypothetical protein